VEAASGVICSGVDGLLNLMFMSLPLDPRIILVWITAPMVSIRFRILSWPNLAETDRILVSEKKERVALATGEAGMLAADDITQSEIDQYHNARPPGKRIHQFSALAIVGFLPTLTIHVSCFQPSTPSACLFSRR
jgi:hypothetical protein